MSNVSTNQTKTAGRKRLNLKKVGAIAATVAILAGTIYAFGFTTKGRTIVRVLIDPAPAVDAYAAQDAWNSQFKLQVAGPKAE